MSQRVPGSEEYCSRPNQSFVVNKKSTVVRKGVCAVHAVGLADQMNGARLAAEPDSFMVVVVVLMVSVGIPA